MGLIIKNIEDPFLNILLIIVEYISRYYISNRQFILINLMD